MLRRILAESQIFSRLRHDGLTQAPNYVVSNIEAPSGAALIKSFTSLLNFVPNQGQLSYRAIHTSNVSPQTTTELEGSEGQAATASAVNPLQQTPSTLFAPSIEGDSAEELRAKAILRNVAISPRKLNDFVRILRGLSLEDALIQCQAHHKKSAGICAKVLKSAAANAVNNHGLDGGKLAVEEVWVGKGQYYKRVSMHAKGRSGIRHKYHSHLTIVLKEVEGLRRRTRVIPMLPERKKWQNLREKDVSGRESKRWWTWFPQNERPAGLSNAE